MKKHSAGLALVEQFSASLQPGDEWDERESAVLELARRQADDIQMLEGLLADQGATVTGSQGQLRLNPVIAELRLQRQSLARLLEGIRLPDEGYGNSKNIRKVRAAQSRWTRAAG